MCALNLECLKLRLKVEVLDPDAPSTDAPSTDAPSTDAQSTDAPTTAASEGRVLAVNYDHVGDGCDGVGWGWVGRWGG